MAPHAPDSQPLLQTLHDLLTAYQRCVVRAEELIAALATADSAAVHAAVAAQAVALSAVDAAEQRRRMAVRGLVYAYTGRTLPPDRAQPDPKRSWQPTGADTEHGGAVTSTTLLRLLPPEAATRLGALRHELLLTLVHLQTLHQRAAALARSGQTVVERVVLAAGLSDAAHYGARGERVTPFAPRSGAARAGRWAV